MISNPNVFIPHASAENQTARKFGITKPSSTRKAFSDVSVNSTSFKIPQKQETDKKVTLKETFSTKKAQFSAKKERHYDDDLFELLCSSKEVEDNYEDIMSSKKFAKLEALSSVREEVVTPPPIFDIEVNSFEILDTNFFSVEDEFTELY